jgi:putative two-component system response regulator
MKVLMVDDEINLLSSYRRLLNESFDLATAESGEKALELIESAGPFAVIVSDYKMPKMNGVELLKQVRVMAPDTVRIMLTGQGDLNIAMEAVNQGNVFRFLVKPCPHEELVQSISEGLSQYEAASRQQEVLRQEVFEAFYQKNLQGTFKMISTLLERKDPYTAGHQLRVSRLAGAIAVEMGLEDQTVECVKVSASLHDIGKIYTPSEILSKPGRLSELEFNLIKDHARAGYELLQEIELPWPVADIVLQHHERCDGSGYPKGLQGPEILLEARIIGVADVVEAITAHRPYRSALGLDAAISEIQKFKGRHFDPGVVDACMRVLQEKSFAWE